LIKYDEAFIKEIRANPKDDIPRLILADYLEEAGDPHAKLIRAQVELAKLQASDIRRLPLEEQESDLLGRYGDTWLAPLREMGVEGASVRCFNKGLIERVKIKPEKWLENANEICRISPALYQVHWFKIKDDLQSLSNADMPKQITSLDASINGLEDFHLAEFESALWLPQLTELNLSLNKLGDVGLQSLVTFDCPQLRKLQLRVNKITHQGIEALANSKFLNNLTHLSLSVNEVGSNGAQLLAQSEFVENLQELDLASNNISNQGTEFLAQSEGFSSLRTLSLRSNSIQEIGFRTFRKAIQANRFPAMKSVDLRGNRIDRNKANKQNELEGDLGIDWQF
jgi:uncharacterized protein (TIGR02996 family)